MCRIGTESRPLHISKRSASWYALNGTLTYQQEAAKTTANCKDLGKPAIRRLLHKTRKQQKTACRPCSCHEADAAERPLAVFHSWMCSNQLTKVGQCFKAQLILMFLVGISPPTKKDLAPPNPNSRRHPPGPSPPSLSWEDPLPLGFSIKKTSPPSWPIDSPPPRPSETSTNF